MHLELDNDEVMTLRDLLRERVTQLDKQINHADSLRFKDELRKEERCVERILGALSSGDNAGPSDWPAREFVSDTDK